MPTISGLADLCRRPVLFVCGRPVGAGRRDGVPGGADRAPAAPPTVNQPGTVWRDSGDRCAAARHFVYPRGPPGNSETCWRQQPTLMTRPSKDRAVPAALSDWSTGWIISEATIHAGGGRKNLESGPFALKCSALVGYKAGVVLCDQNEIGGDRAHFVTLSFSLYFMMLFTFTSFS